MNDLCLEQGFHIFDSSFHYPVLNQHYSSRFIQMPFCCPQVTAMPSICYILQLVARELQIQEL
jgi:hypothetical protein